MAKMENTYRMTDRDIRLMIQLRATNADIFTGRKNSAMRGWRAIRKEMGIHGALTAQQLKKKWDNLKDKYRSRSFGKNDRKGPASFVQTSVQSRYPRTPNECSRPAERSQEFQALKNPPVGMETQSSSWRWFHLMDDAMCGRLAGTASVVQPSQLSEDEEDNNTAPPLLILPKMEAVFSGLSPAETGTLEAVVTLGDVLELSGIDEEASITESPADVVPADPDHMRSSDCEPTPMESHQPSQTAILYANLLRDCSVETNKTPSLSSHAVREDVEVDEKLVELQSEWRALEREQAEFDRELIALERDREMLNRDMTNLDRDRALIERDRVAVERDRAALERDRVVLDRDRAFLDRDRAFLDRDRAFLERAREDLERERVLLRREKAILEREGTAVDGHDADMTTEKEVVLHTRFYQRLMASDMDPDQLESRQRLVHLFQRLVEKL